LNERSKIVQDYLQKFSNLGSRSIAQAILYNHGDLFGNNLDNIRSRIRRYRGTHGNFNRTWAKVTHNVSHPIPASWSTNDTPYVLPPGLWLILCDLHVPFHEVKPIEAAIAFGKQAKVTGVLLNGDLHDCAAVSFWQSGMKRDFDKELMVLKEMLQFIRHEFPKQQIVYKLGNHEYRLPRYYQSHAPELIGIPLAAMSEVYGLEYMDIDVADYRQTVMAGELPILHGHEVKRLSYAVNPARGLFLRTKSWALCAHAHRTSEHTERDIRENTITTWSVGCLCNLSPDYDKLPNWNWGFATVKVEKDGNFDVSSYRILSSGRVV
jgi:hypothetical protein